MPPGSGGPLGPIGLVGYVGIMSHGSDSNSNILTLYSLIGLVSNFEPFSEEPRGGKEAFAPEVIITTPETLMRWPGLMPLRYCIVSSENSIC